MEKIKVNMQFINEELECSCGEAVVSILKIRICSAFILSLFKSSLKYDIRIGKRAWDRARCFIN